eukprot:TRINITY_DN8636_c0_g1_i2.p1 TRINITY_DN8636_c0_g1~~TRINITY_DN8636_c0_g1_i2.p1  ORF type:complete len:893 (-),score=181.99 TRINITY_DN8636_c0_g1_i2:158-2836(-)
MWRRFQFFEKELVKDTGSKEAKQSLKKISIACSSGGNGFLFFGDIEGGVHVANRDLDIPYYWKAYNRTLTHMQQGTQKNLLVTVGNDEDSIDSTVKVWNLEVLETQGFPSVYRSFQLGHMTVTELAVSPDCAALAIGMADGTVIISLGDITKDRAISSWKTTIRRGYPITALGFVGNGRKWNLFAATSDSVSVVEVTRDGLGEVETLDGRGCEIGCAAITSSDELVIGRKEAIYFYNSHGRGPCRAFEGDRKICSWFRNYLVVVDQAPTNIKYNTLTIYDDKNKFIGYSGSFENVYAVVSEWGFIFVVTKDGTVYKLVEKDTQTKLETLFRKNLYQVAIDMADSNHLDKNAIVEIFVQYGDHLYDKGDYDGAIEQYIKTIGFGTIEPSYVIKQFLDAQRIHNLTLYLEKLHEAGEANDNHTTLLLNCYTKLKQRENSQKLDDFIKKPDLKFDIETAIRVCRQAGYYEHVLELAKRTGSHYWVLKVLLEDLRRDREALAYIMSLPFHEAQENFRKYGQLLIQTLPTEVTIFLLQLCTGSSKADPDQFIPLFVNSPDHLIQFLQDVLDKGRATPLLFNTLLDLYLRGDDDETPAIKKQRQEKALELLSNPQANYDTGTALVLCQMQDFKQGQLVLYEKLMLYNEILQHYMDIDDYANVVKTCRKYSKVAPYLWARALVYLTDKDPELNLRQEIIEVLRNIDSNNIFPPNQVIKMLSQGNAYLGLITSYTSKHIQEQEREISEDTKRIKSYQEETARHRQEIEDLTVGVKKFQFHKCTRCSQVLDLPAVHFLCNHSFHQRCLGENENICPECAEENKDFRNRQRALEENARKHSEFFRQLDTSGNNDGFGIIAKYFGRGVFDKPQQETVEAGVLPTLDPGLFQDLVGTLITELKK